MNEHHYELLAIVSGVVSDAELEDFRNRLEEILKKHVATIHYMHNLGRRKLAYQIKHQAHGTYFLCEFDAVTENITKLERALALTSEILRHCIVRRKTIGSPIPLERREEEARTGRRSAAPRKTQDEELLGKAAPLVDTPLLTQSPAHEDKPDAGPSTPVEDPTTSEENAKKKGKKASYEELDQKLNELLSDDII